MTTIGFPDAEYTAVVDSIEDGVATVSSSEMVTWSGMRSSLPRSCLRSILLRLALLKSSAADPNGLLNRGRESPTESSRNWAELDRSTQGIPRPESAYICLTSVKNAL